MRRGFTLIELLIVIAIIAVLSVVVILALNPAELLKQARDGTRISDLGTLNTALSLYAIDIGGSMGSATLIYLSLPDPAATTTAGSDCSSLGFPSGVFHCAASSTLTKTDGTGWIPLNFKNISSGAPLRTLPLDPENSLPSSTLYYSYTTDGNRWKLSAFPESQKYGTSQPQAFMNGSSPSFLGTWIPVPANATFGTSNFWVMKYEAKSVGGIAVSQSALTPWVSISQTDAAAACSAIGAHLITNNEWQTIAWNAENVASNWSGGVVGGTGQYMGRGNSDNSVAEPASSDDTQTDYLTNYADFTHQRTLTLSNGSVIWDMAGNVWEWTNNTIMGAQKPIGSTSTWAQWTAVTYAGSDLTAQTAGPANTAWDSSKGIGQYYEGANTGGPYGFLRGGNWINGTDAGVESLHLDIIPSYTVSTGIGFRCAR